MKSNKQISNEIHELAREYSINAVKPYIAILQPRRDFREMPAQLLSTHDERMIDDTAMSISFHSLDGNPVDVSYNYLFDQALSDNVKYAMCIEEDTVVPFYGMSNLVATAEKYPDSIIVGIYYVKFGGPMIGKIDEDGRWMHIDVTPNTGLRRNISFCGMGCALIPTSVLKKIKETFVDIPLCCAVPERCWNDEDVKQIGQDNWFYYLATKCGIEIIADTSVHCLHMELATGKYTAHPNVNLDDYFTVIPVSTPLQLNDRERVKFDYLTRMTMPAYINGLDVPIKELPTPYSEETLNKVVRCLKDVNCSQNYYEAAMMCHRLLELDPKVILEIGVDRGGTMNLWLNFSKFDATYIGLDIDIKYVQKRDHKQAKIFIEADSQNPGTILKVMEALEGKKVDFLFIDGNHKKTAVENDYNIYSRLVRPGGIVAFHDIDCTFRPTEEDVGAGVTWFWNDFKKTHKVEEFINTEVAVHMGIGIIVMGDE